MTEASAARVPRTVIVPVPLGCCPAAPRCLLCNPSPQPPSPDTLAALIEHYRSERSGPDDSLVVGFYGGALPSEQLLDAIGERPFQVRVRPDLMSRADAAKLVDRGVRAVELDVLCFDDLVLRACRRPYRKRRVLQMAHGIRDAGVRAGVTLAPGLPGSDFQTSVADATIASEHFDTARLHPVLVLDQSDLREVHAGGQYTPLGLGEAVTVCRVMMDVLEGAGVEVIRVGMQPGPDGLGRAIAGPAHSSLRELVESRRALDRLFELVAPHRGAPLLHICCAPTDVGRTHGPNNQHRRSLRAAFQIGQIEIRPRSCLVRNQWTVEIP
ncbi:MAG: hypothetical protein GWP91_03570 [Rhodobacterales bacterium]|nr:hypothetical protein [Rhodobacterales bacterium]